MEVSLYHLLDLIRNEKNGERLVLFIFIKENLKVSFSNHDIQSSKIKGTFHV
jgi:hypothetical protein